MFALLCLFFCGPWFIVENAGAPPHPPLHLLPRTMDLWTVVRPRRFPFFS
jgi:hypothetical protein